MDDRATAYPTRGTHTEADLHELSVQIGRLHTTVGRLADDSDP